MSINTKVPYGLVACIAVLGLSGCATTGSTDPTKVGFGGGLSYQVGMNKQLEQELEQRQAESDRLKIELQQSKEKLAKSTKRSEELESKLRTTQFKSQKSRDKARKLAAELSLKRQDLQSKQQELSDLERRITAMKSEKRNKKETLARLTQAEKELTQTKQEVAVLTEYLEANLYNEAENALKYD